MKHAAWFALTALGLLGCLNTPQGEPGSKDASGPRKWLDKLTPKMPKLPKL